VTPAALANPRLVQSAPSDEPGSPSRPASGREGGEKGEGAPRPPDAAELALIDAARRGDRAAWGSLYRRYARMVHAVLLARVPSRDAEDLVQDVFAKAMRSIGTVRAGASVGPWLAAVARNHATDFLRQRRHRPSLPTPDEERAAPAPNPCDPLDARAVLDAIRRLPDAYRETLLMRLVEGLTGPEIAQRTGMTHGSVRVNLTRGMAMLRHSLGMEDAP
jgi:RNA polymerase sigma-70 factor (ECF subfamily)